MDFFCIPMICGCNTSITPEGDQTQRVCPRCNNVSVLSAKSTEYFELCFVPLVPFSKKHIWVCGICQWKMPIQQGEPPLPSYYPQPQSGYYPPQPQPGYYPPQSQPGYYPQPPPNAYNYWPKNTGQGT